MYKRQVFFGLICGSARAEYYRQPGTRVVSRTVTANYVRPLPRKETQHPRYTLAVSYTHLFDTPQNYILESKLCEGKDKPASE